MGQVELEAVGRISNSRELGGIVEPGELFTVEDVDVDRLVEVGVAKHPEPQKSGSRSK